MTKNYALAAFCVGMLLLLGLVWLHTGSLVPPSGGGSIWFHAGLFTLFVGRFITEYRFTKPNDVLLNCLAVFVATSTLSSPPLPGWWEALRWGSLLLAASAVALSWDRGAELRREEQPWRSFLYQVVIGVGRADVLFSIVFVLALLSYFELGTPETTVFVVAWGLILLVSNINLPIIGKIILRSREFPDRKIIGVAHSFIAPSIVFCTHTGDKKPKMHELVGFCQSSVGACHCVGIVIGERSSANETRIAVALIELSIADSQLNESSLLVTMSERDRSAYEPPIDDAELQRLTKVIGTVAKGTGISQLKFELFGSPKVRAGSMLQVGHQSKPVFYQVFDGIISEEKTVSESARAFVEGEAEQIGSWDTERGGFETHDWVARERAPVFLVDEQTAPPEYTLKSNEATIGTIPHSSYSVNVDVHDFVLYHSAILGVTGAGKSFLTFAMIEECQSKGIKVVCVDPSGDYQRYLHDAVLLPDKAAIKAFLQSDDQMVGIIETSSGQVTAVDLAYVAASTCLNWCKETRTPDQVLTPVPRVMVVLEEAHLLVPEWNFNPQPNQQALVNRTAQIVLQARKYGLGFLVVSQRTANVTKSVLNQCNTIVSFQAFDETGFDFLKNYMGPFHVRALPNLKPRHCLIVGKASRSRRPLMVHLSEQVRTIRQQPAASRKYGGSARQ